MDLNLEANGTEMFVSPTVIYNTVDLRNESSEPCKDKMCKETYEFTWLGKEPCNSSFICTDLSGDPCADYGIVLAQDNGSVVEAVCHEGQVHIGFLQQRESIELTMWFTKHAEYDANCYLWCINEDTFGGTDVSDNASSAVEDLFLDLVNMKTLF